MCCDPARTGKRIRIAAGSAYPALALFLREEIARAELYGSARKEGDYIRVTIEGDEERVSLFEAALCAIASGHADINLEISDHPTSGGGGFTFEL